MIYIQNLSIIEILEIKKKSPICYAVCKLWAYRGTKYDTYLVTINMNLMTV